MMNVKKKNEMEQELQELLSEQSLRKIWSTHHTHIWMAVVIIALVAGFMLGGGHNGPSGSDIITIQEQETPTGPGTRSIVNAADADDTTVGLGNKLSNASASIDQLFERFK
jgi:hypothetical protein